MDQRHLPPREPGELEISAPVSVPGPPMGARTRMLLVAVALLALASLLTVALGVARRGLAAQRAQATQTAAVVRQVRAARATETAVAQSAATLLATHVAASNSAYSVAVPGCPLGEPVWQLSNFDPAHPNFICGADSLQILTAARSNFGVYFCVGCSLSQKHDTQIHVFDIQPNVAEVDFSDGPVMLAQHMDGSWQLFGQHGLLAGGTQALPRDLILRMRSDGSQVTVWVNGVTYATVATDLTLPVITAVYFNITSRDFSQPSALRVKDFSFTPLP
jgi:hypothetical protein